MNVLALDLGTKTGWAIGTKGAFSSGIWNLKGGRYEGGGMRFLRFKGFLTSVGESSPCGGPGVDKIVYEEVRRHKGTDAAHIYGGLQATLAAWCEERNVPFEAVPVGTIKKFWTGKGNAGKEAMVAECLDRFMDVADHNEADAVALWHFETEGGQ